MTEAKKYNTFVVATTLKFPCLFDPGFNKMYGTGILIRDMPPELKKQAAWMLQRAKVGGEHVFARSRAPIPVFEISGHNNQLAKLLATAGTLNIKIDMLMSDIPAEVSVSCFDFDTHPGPGGKGVAMGCFAARINIDDVYEGMRQAQVRLFEDR